jgi:four helix bundle protein
LKFGIDCAGVNINRRALCVERANICILSKAQFMSELQSNKKKYLARSYTDLYVYQLAFESAMKIYEISKNWPKEEKYSLTDQIRRSSRSVCGNIAEAWRKRRYPAHFVSKLSDSDSEGAETEVWLAFALRCNYLKSDQHAKLMDNYDHIGRMLSIMTADPYKWKLNKSI